MIFVQKYKCSKFSHTVTCLVYVIVNSNKSYLTYCRLSDVSLQDRRHQQATLHTLSYLKRISNSIADFQQITFHMESLKLVLLALFFGLLVLFLFFSYFFCYLSHIFDSHSKIFLMCDKLSTLSLSQRGTGSTDIYRQDFYTKILLPELVHTYVQSQQHQKYNLLNFHCHQ